MQVEHITLGGNTALRDTDGILPETVNLLQKFQIRRGHKTLPFPRTSLNITITAQEEGALFNIEKAGQMAIVNFCCFEEKHTAAILDLIRSLGRGQPRIPVLSNWLYSAVINPFILSPGEMVTAGEIELYIYYSLYLARQ